MKLKYILSITAIAFLLMLLGSCTNLDEHIYDTLDSKILKYTDEEIESIRYAGSVEDTFCSSGSGLYLVLPLKYYECRGSLRTPG